MKEFVKVEQPTVKASESTLTVPTDAVPLFLNGVPNSAVPWARLVAFLHSKSMSVDYLKGYNPNTQLVQRDYYLICLTKQ